MRTMWFAGFGEGLHDETRGLRVFQLPVKENDKKIEVVFEDSEENSFSFHCKNIDRTLYKNLEWTGYKGCFCDTPQQALEELKEYWEIETRARIGMAKGKKTHFDDAALELEEVL